MIDNLLTVLGGLGLFLVGMITMTDALRSLASEQIRSFLLHYTKTPTSGALAGAACTAVVQSSSATTVAAVGFVSAELMTFSSALGIVFGANLGTTITGWMVALIGFKLQLGAAMLPVVLIGAIARLFAPRNYGQWGMVVAGFGLIFVGLDFMQPGIAGLAGIVDFENLPGDTFGGRLVLVVMGLAFTLVTRSSSAGVAATLAALFGGLIEFQQAAALVIGMDVGTSFTALIASIGGSVGARRTGLSHVVFNGLTGIGALLLITPYVIVMELVAPGVIAAEPELSLVGFHTFFNGLGVLAVLPFAPPFARLVERLVPDPSRPLVDRLDPMLLSDASLALPAVQFVTQDAFRSVLHHVRRLMGREVANDVANLADIKRALDQTQAYVDQIHLASSHGGDSHVLIAMIHVLDHLQRLQERCDEDGYRAAAAIEAPTLTDQCALLIECVEAVESAIGQGEWWRAQHVAADAATRIDNSTDSERNEIILGIGIGSLSVADGTLHLEAVRWLQRVSHHLASITSHQWQAMSSAGEEAESTPES